MRRLPANWWPVGLSVPLGLMTVATTRYALLLPAFYGQLLGRYPAFRSAFVIEGAESLVRLLALTCGGTSFLLWTASLLGLIPRRRTLALLRKAHLAGILLAAFYSYVVIRLTGALMAHNVELQGAAIDVMTVFRWRCRLLAPAVACALVLAFLYLTTWRAGVMTLYTGTSCPWPGPGDRVLENLRTHGRDPRYRTSLWVSAGLHLLGIVILPGLLTLRGCVEPYRVPKGSGTPQVAVIQAVRPLKKPKKKYVVNPQSAILFRVPDLEDSQIVREVDHMTQLTYVADPTRVLSLGQGKLGVGGGTRGGWPDGMEDALVRFIRLEYNGPGWDDGMDSISRADMNFLDYFRKLTGFNTARKSESHPISHLRKYAKGFAPPFVYMTGHGDIRVSPPDIATLREYLLDGGLLFADCGSPQFDRAFRAFMAQVFPGEPLRTISDDDPIFQMPFVFLHGAPPLWHHGGHRAMGIKHRGRWVVFYHPGDVNDAWKTGHSGLDPKLAAGAMEVGVNIIHYAFTHYLEMTRKYRK